VDRIMETGSGPPSKGKTYGEMAAANLHRAGWTFTVTTGRSTDGRQTWRVRAQRGGKEVIVCAPDEGIAFLEVERQSRALR
jgi:hypothetical protein